MLVWTDGGFDPVAHAAGFGAFYGDDNPRNVAGVLDSGTPSAPRAELAALASLLEDDPRPLSVKIDCRYVVDGYNVYRHHNRARAWLRWALDAVPIANADLWRCVDAAERRRAAARVATRVGWCRGHPLRRHVLAGETTELSAYGNCAVDALATTGCRRAADAAAAAAAGAAPTDVANRPT